MTQPIQDEEFAEGLESQYIIEEEGRIEIGNDVIARIAGIAATEVEGVSLENRFAIADWIGRREKEPVKGINVVRDEGSNSVTITCTVLMAYGRDMYEAAVRLRQHVKQTVQKMTHVIVKRVDVKIVGILMEPERREPPTDIQPS